MNSDEPLRIVAPEKDRHGAGIAELVALTFGGDDPIGWRDRARRGMADAGEYYRWRDSRIGLLGDRVVTHVGVVRYAMRLGAGKIPVAGVAAVATAPFDRRQGLMRETFAATVKGFREAGYAASILFGIDNLYHKFGYVRAWSDSTFSMMIADLASVGDPPPVQYSREPPWPVIQNIYNSFNSGMFGTAVRPDSGSVFTTLKDVLVAVWRDTDDRPAGYVIAKTVDTGIEVLDQAGTPEKVLSVARRIAQDHFRDRLIFPTLSLASPLAQRLRSGTCTIRITPRACGGPMIRTVSLSACLDALRPNLQARLASSSTAKEDFDLLLSDGRQQVLLQFRGGRLTVHDEGWTAETPNRVEAGDNLATLLIGGAMPREVLDLPGVCCSGNGRRLAEVLFPEEFPMLPRIDRF